VRCAGPTGRGPRHREREIAMKRRVVTVVAVLALSALAASPARADRGAPGTTFPEQPDGHTAGACAVAGAAGTGFAHASGTAAAIGDLGGPPGSRPLPGKPAVLAPHRRGCSTSRIARRRSVSSPKRSGRDRRATGGRTSAGGLPRGPR